MAFSWVDAIGQGKTVPAMPHPDTPQWDRWLLDGLRTALNEVQAVPRSVTYWVSPDGSDANDGLSAANAFATVDKAHTEIEAGGVAARLYIRAGRYASTSDLVWTVPVWITGVAYDRNTRPWFSRFEKFTPTWTDNGDGTHTAPLATTPGAVRRWRYWDKPLRPATTLANCQSNAWTWYYDSGADTITINPGSDVPIGTTWSYCDANDHVLFRLKGGHSIIEGVAGEGWGCGVGTQGALIALDGGGYEPSFAMRCQVYYGGKHILQHHIPSAAAGGVGFFIGNECGFMTYAGTANASESSLNSFNANGGNQCVFLGNRVVAGTIQRNVEPGEAAGKGAVFGCHGGTSTPECDFFGALDNEVLGGEFSHGVMWSGNNSTAQDLASVFTARIFQKRTTIGRPGLDHMTRGFESMSANCVSVDDVCHLRPFSDSLTEKIPAAQHPDEITYGRRLYVDTQNNSSTLYTTIFRTASDANTVKTGLVERMRLEITMRVAQSFQVVDPFVGDLHVNWRDVVWVIQNVDSTAPTAGNNGQRIGIDPAKLANGATLANVKFFGLDNSGGYLSAVDDEVATPLIYEEDADALADTSSILRAIEQLVDGTTPVRANDGSGLALALAAEQDAMTQTLESLDTRVSNIENDTGTALPASLANLLTSVDAVAAAAAPDYLLSRIVDNGDGTKWLEYFNREDDPATDPWVYRVRFNARGEHLSVEVAA
ncbi:MAG: hypothetical protein AAF333_13380 [Planctomycetota bacterium]